MKKSELIKWAGDILNGVECACGKAGSVANHDYCLAGSAQRWLMESWTILHIHQEVSAAGAIRLESKGLREIETPKESHLHIGERKAIQR